MPGTEAAKDLKLRLQIEADHSKGSQALQEIAKDAQRAQQETNKLSASIRDAQQQAAKYSSGIYGSAPGGGSGGKPAYMSGAASSYDPLVSAMRTLEGSIRDLHKSNSELHHAAEKVKEKSGGDGKEGGFFSGATSGLGKFAAGLGKFAATAATVAEVVSGLVVAFQGLENPMTTTREKTIAFTEAAVGWIPLIGDAIVKLQRKVLTAMDRLENPELAKRLDREEYERPIIRAQKQAHFEYERNALKLNNDTEGAEFRANSIRAVPHFDFAMQDYDRQFHAESVGLQRQFPRGSALIGHGGMVPAGPLTRTLSIPGMPSVTLPGMAGMGMNAAEGGLSTLWAEQPGLHSAFQELQEARRNVDLAKRQAANSQREVELAQPGFAHADRVWRSAVRESETTFNSAKGADSSTRGDIASAAYKDALKYTNGDWSHSIAAFAATSAFIAPEWSGAKRMLGMGDDKGTPLHLNDAKNKEEDALFELTNRRADLEEKVRKSKEDQLNITRQQYNEAQKETGIMRQQLSIIDQQVQKAKSGVEQFGAMDKVGQATILNAAERFQKQGRQGITQEELGMLRGNAITGDWVGRALQRDAANDPMTKRLFEITGMQDLQTLGKQKNALEKEIGAKVSFDETKFAEIMAEQTKSSNAILLDIAKTLKAIAGRKGGFDHLAGAEVRAGGGG